MAERLRCLLFDPPEKLLVAVKVTVVPLPVMFVIVAGLFILKVDEPVSALVDYGVINDRHFTPWPLPIE
jgi:hypothetical protein